jgi:hypothetical protein
MEASAGLEAVNKMAGSKIEVKTDDPQPESAGCLFSALSICQG